ncbi:MAG: hypothetical protein LBD89_04475 [Tannerellaceae bacterium]|jgi:hypothetical protein|nr:hypothetical protein [Tannerellaceae bacterium]
MKRFCLYLLWLIPLGGSAREKITFFNQGDLYVENALYIRGDFRAMEASAVCQSGTTSLTGDFINDVKTGRVFTTEATKNRGVFEFCGTTPQRITGSAPKERYIHFPDTLRVRNDTVLMQPNRAATTKVADIRSGRLILESEAENGRSVTAHLLVENEVMTHPNAIQVNLDLGDNYQKKKLVGFTPPFERLYADYFFFNLLSRPTARGLFGNDGRLITSPLTPLNPGEGYLLGLGVIAEGDPYFTERIDPRWAGADPARRVKEKFQFFRGVAEPNFSRYLNETLAPGYVTGEKLVVGDVKPIRLERGFNYLGNPYMAPLDLSDILQGSTSSDWGVPDNTLKKAFYVLSQGEASYENSRFVFSASYLVSQEQGSTTLNSRSVAPMQMFIVATDTPVNLTLPAGKRRHDSSAVFLRSTRYETTDELLLETTDEQTGAYDRTCLVFRSNATLQATDPFDTQKIFNHSGGVNQLYTLSSDDKELMVSVIPTTTERLPLYFIPARLPQRVSLRAGRLNSLTSVSHIFLEDLQTGRLVNLMQTPCYTFDASPSDPIGRFVLHFTPNPATGTDEPSAPATLPRASYREGQVRIDGFRESDRGSEVALYNIQGKLLHRQRLEEIAPCRIPATLPKGIYVVRNKDLALKFTVK